MPQPLKPFPPASEQQDLTLNVAQVMLQGFNKHYRIFREACQEAKRHFETGNWPAVQKASRERIDFYDKRVMEAVEHIESGFRPDARDDAAWQKIKLHYIGLLTYHKQPECAETFFNSVCCKILHRTYFNNNFIFVRPAVSTEHIEAEPPSYRPYYPGKYGLRPTVARMLRDIGLQRPFADLRRDLRNVLRVWRKMLPRPLRLEANHQIQILSSLFYRNKGAYLVGKMINGNQDYPFVIPVLHDQEGKLFLDTVLLERRQLDIFFSTNRAYFLVDMEVPSAYVHFLRGLLPYKPQWEIYTLIGLQKHGKNLFYRDFLHHLRHSSDDFIIAPGIRGLVMSVFTLPSYPYVFKVIKDVIAPPKEVTRQLVKEKYWLVKHHDRVGRMADTLEYSDVAFPRKRFSAELLDELRKLAPSLIDEEGDTIVIKHMYIERRMVPLNIFLDKAEAQQRDEAIDDYGLAIKQLAAANIFAGDLLFKNFGVTRYGRVVFYDYDEIDYLTNCNFRKLPQPQTEEQEMASEPWYSVGPTDIFPEEFATFLLTDGRVRECFMRHHADLLDAASWQATQQRIAAGQMQDVFPYAESLRFCNLLGQR
ncbi:MAG: bifunctional isocitrate dehydrogenase kinase/phosphatase [Betaproteobacteria bacterium]|nr:MAG: bifunctional isocitrate dehydrogenase kinase/phosphatase [Betaproteobacteria bacterium]